MVTGQRRLSAGQVYLLIARPYGLQAGWRLQKEYWGVQTGGAKDRVYIGFVSPPAVRKTAFLPTMSATDNTPLKPLSLLKIKPEAL